MLKPTSPISIVRNGDRSLVRAMFKDSKNLIALVLTENGLGVSCEFKVSSTNDVIFIKYRQLFSKITFFKY